MRVLLTGGGGFLGRPARAALRARGYEVIAAGRSPPAGSAPRDWRACDLLAAGEADRVARECRPDMLVHLAWTSQPGKFWTDPVNAQWAEASLRLVRACAEVGARRICVAGTSYEYDWPADGDCGEENTPLARHTPYDTAKADLRVALSSFAGDGKISLAWARLFYSFGPDEHPDRLVASVARALVAGKPALCSSGRVVRDFMDSRDAGAALAALAASHVEGPVNIASGRGVSVADIAEKLGRIAGRSELVKLGALPDRPAEPARIVADIGRLTREVGFVAGHGLDEGLADAVDFWRRGG